MKTKHTPGPWWVDDDGFIAAGSGEDYKTIASPRCMEPRGNEAEIDANACLIAAAPELLEALERLIEAIEYKPSRAYNKLDLPFYTAISAIAKAKGEA